MDHRIRSAFNIVSAGKDVHTPGGHLHHRSAGYTASHPWRHERRTHSVTLAHSHRLLQRRRLLWNVISVTAELQPYLSSHYASTPLTDIAVIVIIRRYYCRSQ